MGVPPFMDFPPLATQVLGHSATAAAAAGAVRSGKKGVRCHLDLRCGSGEAVLLGSHSSDEFRVKNCHKQSPYVRIFSWFLPHINIYIYTYANNYTYIYILYVYIYIHIYIYYSNKMVNLGMVYALL